MSTHKCAEKRRRLREIDGDSRRKMWSERFGVERSDASRVNDSSVSSRRRSG
jgi:hypothetical protein